MILINQLEGFSRRHRPSLKSEATKSCAVSTSFFCSGCFFLIPVNNADNTLSLSAYLWPFLPDSPLHKFWIYLASPQNCISWVLTTIYPAYFVALSDEGPIQDMTWHWSFGQRLVLAQLCSATLRSSEAFILNTEIISLYNKWESFTSRRIVCENVDKI